VFSPAVPSCAHLRSVLRISHPKVQGENTPRLFPSLRSRLHRNAFFKPSIGSADGPCMHLHPPSQGKSRTALGLINSRTPVSPCSIYDSACHLDPVQLPPSFVTTAGDFGRGIFSPFMSFLPAMFPIMVETPSTLLTPPHVSSFLQTKELLRLGSCPPTHRGASMSPLFLLLFQRATSPRELSPALPHCPTCAVPILLHSLIVAEPARAHFYRDAELFIHAQYSRRPGALRIPPLPPSST